MSSPSWLVISEAYSWFLHRMNEEAARTFRGLAGGLGGLRVFEATRAHHVDVVKVLERCRGTKLTYVDASSLAFMREHKIPRVWATDHHLGLDGAEVLPRT